jgi:hypothetical protein
VSLILTGICLVRVDGAFSPPSPSATGDVVIYASDIPRDALHGSWTAASDPSSPERTKLVTTAGGAGAIDHPLADPADYIDVSFDVAANVGYTIWIRLSATGNSPSSDSLWVQFSDAIVSGSGVYPIQSSSGLLVNLARDRSTSLNGWGWSNGAFWLSQAATVSFPTGGTHTLRIQPREDGVQLDQIVLSPQRFLNASPGSAANDSTIVPKN